MSLLAAATIGDDILHTPLIGQIFKVLATIGVGLLVGLAIMALAVFIVGSGGWGALLLAAVITVAADLITEQITGDASLDDALTKPILDWIDKMVPGVVRGWISTGSPNVFINGMPAARAAGKKDPNYEARLAAQAANPPPWWQVVGRSRCAEGSILIKECDESDPSCRPADGT